MPQHSILVGVLLFVVGYTVFHSHVVITDVVASHSVSLMESVFLPFVYEFSPKHVPQVKTSVEGVEIEMPVDTGSTGTLIGASLLPSVPTDIGTPAHHFFTSSKILYVGRLVSLNISFYGESNTVAEATVPVLMVDKSWRCPWYDPSTPADQFGCPRGPNGEEAPVRDTSQITYMGVGFGRNGAHDGMPYATPAVNPFLNINSINGRSTSPESMHNGYAISTSGVTLGLTPSVMKTFNFVSLAKGVTHDQDPRDWAMVRMRFSIDGLPASPGSGLIDTGISQMYIRADNGFIIPNITIRNPNKHLGTKTVRRVKPGTKIDIGFPSLDEKTAMSYSFVVGENSTLEPTYVLPEKQVRPSYVNTGRNILFGYSIAFDAVAGRFGFRPADHSPNLPHAFL